jgi:hypothetical protein
MFSDLKLCAMARDRQECSLSTAGTAPAPSSNPLPCRFASIDSTSPIGEVSLPGDFFQRLADLAVNDRKIAIRIEDDRTAPVIWGEGRSLRCQFLKMCIRDRWDKCRELWARLDEYDRRDFMTVYRLGPPTADFFLNIMVVEEATWGEVDDMDSRSTSSRSV